MRKSNRRGIVNDVALAMSRRQFLAAGSGILVAAAFPFTAEAAAAVTIKKGGILRAACVRPATPIDPFKVGEFGGTAIVSQSGEYLSHSQRDGTLRPVLAESWEALEGGKVWRYKIRSGVLFHDGSPMTGRDVAATFNRHADPAVGSNALSALRGVLSKGGAVATDDTTVVFTLDSPYGNFPYLTSSDNYNCTILKGGDNTDFANKMNGTGPWQLEEYRPGRGVTFARNTRYWGPAPYVDKVVWTFYEDEGAAILAMQSGAADIINTFSAKAGQALFRNPRINVLSFPSSAQYPVHMRVDMPPFNDARIRRAVALSIDRPGIVRALYDGRAQLGNDSPMSSFFASTDKTVTQRVKNITAAKALMKEAGVPDGFEVELTTHKYLEVPAFAVLLQDQLKEIGIKVRINQMSVEQYFGSLKYGSSPFLDSVFGIDPYGHRGVPNVFINAQLSSGGAWNGAHFKDEKYDALVKQYNSAIALPQQTQISGQIQRLLLEETPSLYLCFINFNSAQSSRVSGIDPTAMGPLYLGLAGFVA
jgi:peptide/nickel transport system substrate-binding protein